MDPELNKNYKESNHSLSSREAALSELHSLLMRLDEKITELSSRIVQKGNDDPQSVEEINVLKVHRKKAHDLRVKVRLASEENWQDLRELAQEIFDQANNLALTPRE